MRNKICHFPTEKSISFDLHIHINNVTPEYFSLHNMPILLSTEYFNKQLLEIYSNIANENDNIFKGSFNLAIPLKY